MHFPDDRHFVNALVPVADAFAGTKETDIIRVDGDGIEFTVYSGVGATGTSTFTVEACDDVSATATTAVPFWYKEVATDPGDTEWTLATASGFTRTAGSNYACRIFVPADLIGQTGRAFARLKAVEVVDSAVLGGILASIVNPRKQPQKRTVLS